MIARSGVGYDSVDVEAARQSGVVVCNTPGVNHDSVAELAMGLILDSARNISNVIASVREGEWPRSAGFELKGSTVAIFGFGASGRALATLARAFGMRVLVVSSLER